MLTHVEVEHGLAIVHLGPRSPGARDLSELRDLLQRLNAQGVAGVLFECAALTRLSYAGIAALLELSADQQVRIGLCALRPGPRQRLQQSGIAEALPLFDSLDTARRSPEFQALSLRGCRAVILSAGQGSRVAPLTEETPKPMLDILGRPILDHIIVHLQRFGLRDFLINPGHLGPQIPAYFKDRRALSMFFAPEGQHGPQGWNGAPIGSASTLVRLQREFSALQGDTLVLCGDALIDLDLAQLMAAHRTSGAEVTIAAQTVQPADTEKYGIIVADAGGRVSDFQEKPAPGTARSCLANVGVYVISDAAIARLPERPGQDIAADLLPTVLRAGGHVQVHAPAFSWVDVGCGRDYFAAVAAGLRGQVPGVRPDGREVRPGLWLADGASVSPRAQIEGPCYLAPGAQVLAGSRIIGPSMIGANSVAEGRTLIRHSILRPDTRVCAGAVVDAMIAGPNWAVDHRRADGSLQNRSALERVQALDAEQPQLARAGISLARTA